MDLFDTSLLPRVLWAGVGATAVMDLWLLLLKALGVPALNFAFIGRWAGHLARGRLAHAAIAKSPAVPGENALGWAVHYATGVAFAVLLALWAGPAWFGSPTLGPALAVGLATVAAPLLVLQPAMGAGIASRRTATPLRNVLRSVANHAVFGVGLYLAAAAFNLLQP
jgi:hypothetical protein